jgi:peptidoglycan/LPS O-acetylase OafA/YrhL
MIKPLTSLRFFFALLVFFSHIHLFGVDRPNLERLNKLYFHEGHIGVTFFYVLSGFILTHNYRQKFIISAITKKSFWISRFSRIYPLHFITLILALPITLNGFRRETTYWFFKVVLNGTLIQSWFPFQDIYWSFNAPSWSISTELFFYFMFPFLVLYFQNLKYFTFLFFTLFLALLYFISISSTSTIEDIVNINPFVRLLDFGLGILLYRLYSTNRFSNFFSTFKRATFIEFSVILVIVLFFRYHTHIPIGYRYSVYYWIPICLLLFTFSFQNGLVSRLLSFNFMIKLGEISFSFYLIHMIVARYFKLFLEDVYMFKNDLVLTLTIFTISLILSYFSHYYFEKSAMKSIRKFALTS